MLRADHYIKTESLHSWTQTWDENQYIEYFTHQIKDYQRRLKVRASMEENIVKIKKICRDMGPDLSFASYLQLLNRIVFNCYFKQGNSALQIGNFYEEILLPADHETHLKMFTFHDQQREIGALRVMLGHLQIGQLGEQSDMFHLVYDTSFLDEDEIFDQSLSLPTEGTFRPPFSVTSVNDDYLTLKIWEPEALQMPIHQFVDLFLYQCSTRLNLNFRRTAFDILPESQTHPLETDFEITPLTIAPLSLLYFNSAAHHLPVQIRFLSYYRAISCFFDRLPLSADHSGAQSVSEFALLAQLLHQALDVKAFQAWLELHPERAAWFSEITPLTPDGEESDFSLRLSARVLSLRADMEAEQTALKLSEDWSLHALPLVRFLASQVMEYWSATD